MFHLFTLPVLGAIVVAILATHALIDFVMKRNARRELIGDASEKASSLGMVKTAKVAKAYSEGRYVDFMHDLKAFIKGFCTDKDFLVGEVKGLLAHLAGTPDGLKLLTDAVAAVAPKVAAAA